MRHAPHAAYSISRSRALLASLRLAVLSFLADPQWLVPSMIAPVIFGLVAYELFLGSGPWFVIYAILGAGMMSMWGQTLYGSGWATGQDRELGTLEPTLSAPTPYLYVVFGRVAWNTVSGLLGGAIVFVVVAVTYGHPLPIVDPVAFALLFAVVIVSLASVGIVLSAAFVYTRYAGFIQNVGEFAFYVGTGCMFPVVLLPFWTTPFALIFPPTWALDALRYQAIPGYHGLPWGFAWDLLGAVVTTSAYLGAAGAVFRRVEHRVLEIGDLSDY
ncbi:MAG: ABC transporter permease [Thermoplasmata archaeon]|nr:ABC transporter permease [Thermoplasmata archaeon]